MSSTDDKKPSYASMVVSSRPSTPDNNKRLSSQLTPSVREKSVKRNVSNSKFDRKVNEGADNITNLKQIDLKTLWKPKKKATPPLNEAERDTPNIKRMHDGWIFDKELFDDEVEEESDDEEEIPNQVITSISNHVKQMMEHGTDNSQSSKNSFGTLDEENENHDSTKAEEEEEMWSNDDSNPNNEAEKKDLKFKEKKEVIGKDFDNKEEEESYDVDSMSQEMMEDMINEQLAEDTKSKNTINKKKKKKKKSQKVNHSQENEYNEDTNSVASMDKKSTNTPSDDFPMNDNDTVNSHESRTNDKDKESPNYPSSWKEDKENKDLLSSSEESLNSLESSIVEEIEVVNLTENDKDDFEKDQEDGSIDTIKVGWGNHGPPPPHQKPKSQEATPTHQLPNKNYDPVREDDINSIHSDTTTHNLTQEEANTIIAPKSNRFQLQVTVQAEDAAKLSAQIVNGDKEIPTSASQIVDAIKSCLNEIKSIDADCKIISWKESTKFEHMSPEDDFPITTSEITKFFPGYRPTSSNKNKQFRATIKMRLATTKNQSIFLEHMSDWAYTNGLSFKPTVIQAENPSIVGWLVYSSSFTDEMKLRKILSSALDIEWGFRTQNVTKADSNLDFRNRIKALFILVDKKYVGAAITTAQSIFVTQAANNIRNYRSNFLFFPIEDRVSGKTNMEKFKIMIARQKVHSESIRGEFETFIEADIDDPIYNHPDEPNKPISLRQMIMSIPCQTAMEYDSQFLAKDEEPTFQPLFHSLDFTINSKAKWFNGYPGPGGAGHIFTYYEENQGEALEMISGLGIYLIQHFEQKEKFAKAFGIDHWQGNDGWIWMRNEKRFITTQSRMILENLLEDSNKAIRIKADAIMAMEIQEEQEQQKKEATTAKAKQEKNKNKKQKQVEKLVRQKYKEAEKELNQSKKSDGIESIDMKDLSKMIMRQKKFELKKKQFRSNDEASIEANTLIAPSNEKPSSSLEFNKDDLSTTSSITENSLLDQLESHLRAGDNQEDQDNESTQSITSSLKSFNNITIEQIFAENPGKSPEEAQAIATKMLEHAVTKQLQKGQQLIAQFHQQKQQQIPSTIPKTTTKSSSQQPIVSPEKNQSKKKRKNRKSKKSKSGGRKSTGTKK